MVKQFEALKTYWKTVLGIKYVSFSSAICDSNSQKKKKTHVQLHATCPLQLPDLIKTKTCGNFELNTPIPNLMKISSALLELHADKDRWTELTK
jgi:hypothetical protein